MITVIFIIVNDSDTDQGVVFFTLIRITGTIRRAGTDRVEMSAGVCWARYSSGPVGPATCVQTLCPGSLFDLEQ